MPQRRQSGSILTQLPAAREAAMARRHSARRRDPPMDHGLSKAPRFCVPSSGAPDRACFLLRPGTPLTRKIPRPQGARSLVLFFGSCVTPPCACNLYRARLEACKRQHRNEAVSLPMLRPLWFDRAPLLGDRVCEIVALVACAAYMSGSFWAISGVGRGDA